MPEEYIQLCKDKLREYLISKGFPVESIETNSQNNAPLFYDVAVMDRGLFVEVYIIKLIADINVGKKTDILKSYPKLDSSINVFWVALDETENLRFRLISENAVGSVGKFISLVQANESASHKRFYRGHNSIAYKLLPSIYRPMPNQKGVEYEKEMFYEAVRRCPEDFPETMSTFDKLIKMQHYELPTRLLDITTNPLVALYFACENKTSGYAELIMFDIPQEQVINFESDEVVIYANLAKQENNVPFNMQQLKDDVLSEKPYVNTPIDVPNKVICVSPKLNNPRISHQQGAFFLFGIEGIKSQPAHLDVIPRRIIISSAHKSDILQELSMLGIDKSTLFPELDKVLSYIKSNK